MQSTAVVLLSGGLDSTTALWKVREDNVNLHTLTFTYGSKDETVSIKVTKKLSQLAGANQKIIKLPWLEEFSKNFGTALVSEIEVPKPKSRDLVDTEKAKKMARAVWVPARNLVFLSIAASFAESISGDVEIITGFDREEAQTFPDNSREFVNRINEVLKLAVLEKNIKVSAPLVDMDKDEIAELALELGVPIEYSSSCYKPLGFDNKGRPIHCGVCESCMRRKRGFKAKGAVDRTVYKV
jgi:7-cyano-7-deazaguanine synthase